MYLKISEWETIRDHFSDKEKRELNAALTAGTLYPRAVIIDDDKAVAACAKVRQLLAAQGTVPGAR